MSNGYDLCRNSKQSCIWDIIRRGEKLTHILESQSNELLWLSIYLRDLWKSCHGARSISRWIDIKIGHRRESSKALCISLWMPAAECYFFIYFIWISGLVRSLWVPRSPWASHLTVVNLEKPICLCCCHDLFSVPGDGDPPPPHQIQRSQQPSGLTQPGRR